VLVEACREVALQLWQYRDLLTPEYYKCAMGRSGWERDMGSVTYTDPAHLTIGGFYIECDPPFCRVWIDLPNHTSIHVLGRGFWDSALIKATELMKKLLYEALQATDKISQEKKNDSDRAIAEWLANHA